MYVYIHMRNGWTVLKLFFLKSLKEIYALSLKSLQTDESRFSYSSSFKKSIISSYWVENQIKIPLRKSFQWKGSGQQDLSEIGTIFAHLAVVLAHSGAMLGYVEPSWCNIARTWRVDEAQEHQVGCLGLNLAVLDCQELLQWFLKWPLWNARLSTWRAFGSILATFSRSFT